MRGAYIAGDRLGRKHAYVSSFSLHVLANRKLFVRSLSLWGRLQIRMPRWGGCRCVLNIVCLLCMLHACHLRLACALNYCHSMYHLVIDVYVRLYLLYRCQPSLSACTKLGKIVGMDWQLGVTVRSSACSGVNSPYGMSVFAVHVLLVIVC